MTNNPSHSSRRWLKLFLTTGSKIGLGLFLLLIVAIGLGQWWAKDNLAPMIEKELVKSLKRPIKLGKIEDIGINQIHLSNPNIPATGNDLNQVAVRDVFINFNPLQLLLDRTVKLDIHLVAPSVNLAQNISGSWLTIPPQDKQAPSPIKIEVGTIRIDEGQVVITPYSQNPQPISVSKINLQAEVSDRQDRVKFNGGAQFQSTGQVQLQGNSIIATGATQLVIQGQKLDAAAATRIVKIPQVEIAHGTVDGNLTLAIEPQKSLRIGSKLLVHDGKLIINHVPRSLDQINGWIEVSEQAVKFNQVSTKYDQVAGVINGDLNYQTGYHLRAQTAPVTLPDVFKSIGVKSPFPLAGAAIAQLQLTGKLDQPILTGKFKNSQLSQVDRVQIDQVNGNFKLANGQITLDAIAQPKLGGKIITQGKIQLTKIPQTRFEVSGSQLQGDALSRLYGAKLPQQIQKIGDTSIQGTIEGIGANIQTNLTVKAPQATYPASTNLQITPQGKTIVRDITIAIAGGKVQATGEVTKTNWQLNLQPQNLDTQKLAQISGLNLPRDYDGKLSGNMQLAGLNQQLDPDQIQAQGKLNLQLGAGTITADRIQIDRGNWQTHLSSNALDLQHLETSGLARANSPQATLVPVAVTGGVAGQQTHLPVRIISGDFNVSGRSLKQIKLGNITARGRGKIKLQAGEIQSENLIVSNGNWQGEFSTNKLQLTQLNPQATGLLSGKFNLAGNLQKFTPESIGGTGAGTIDLPEGQIVGSNLQIDRGKWQGNLHSSSLPIGSLAPQIPLKYRKARLDADLRVAGDLQHFQPADITAIGTAKLSLGGGTIQGRQLEVRSGKWRGNFGIDRLKLGDINRAIPTEFQAAQLTGNFVAAGDLSKIKPDQLQVTGAGEVTLSGGKVRAQDFKLAQGNWSSNLKIANLRLGDFHHQLSPQLRSAKIGGNFQVAGNVNHLQPTAIAASGSGKLKLATGGEISANNLKIAAGEWQSDLSINRLSLGAVNQNLPTSVQSGLLVGNFQAAGSLKSPDLAHIQANGQGQIKNILGGKIQVEQLAIANGNWQGRVVADRLQIGKLAEFTPLQITGMISSSVPIGNRVSGQLSANWQVGGNLIDPSLAKLQVVGETKLTNLQLGRLKFDPNLIGNIQANPGQGVDITFAGQNDRLALVLDRNLQPQSFEIKQQAVSARGRVENKLLNLDVEQFPIALLQAWIPKNVGIGQYRFDGNATGNLAINLTKLEVAGNQLEITNPTFGAFQGDRLLANFRYANGQLNLDRTEIQRGTNSYQLEAKIIPGTTTPTFAAKIQVPSGNIEDVRNLFQIFRTEDLFTPLNRRSYGTAADLKTSNHKKIANQPQPLHDELRYLSELRKWLNQTSDRQEQNDMIPDLGNLRGDFSGEILIANTPQAGLSSDFKITGVNWQVDRYQIDQLQAVGNWRNGKLHFDPLNLTIQASQIDIAGDFAANNQNAKINIRNFPVASLTNFINLPVDLSGGINLTAQLTGDLDNPRVSGQASLSNGLMNNTKLQDVASSFNYWDGRLNFVSEANFANNQLVQSIQPLNANGSARTDRLKITGSIPYELPFALKPPASDQIRIDMSLQNQGLQILDIFSKQQLHWIDGQGKVTLSIDGKMKSSGEIASLSANGTAKIVNGKIQSVLMPEPLTEINGDITFDFDRVDIQQLAGKFQRGQVIAAGVIPISDSFSIDPSHQLGIQMNGIAIDLKDKYKGDVNGKLKLLGTALKPILTGNVQLSNGQITLPEAQNTATTILGVQPAIPEATNPNAIQLRNLQLALGENVQITRGSILNFIATGKLDLDGTIDNLRPFGQVQLQKGTVNLFTTQFRLTNDLQTADFFPTLGTDPVLNVRLYAKTLESVSSAITQRNAVASTAANGEINRPTDLYTTSFGSVQTVQVEARVAGLASQLTQRLELTSSPARTQPEIVLLLGGAIAERLTSGGDIGLGVISLASSNLLNNIQDRIGDLFNLSDFRLFPTITKEASSNSSTFGIAAEIGTEITPRISTSVFKILTNAESPYYSVRYRINDQFLLRGSTNLFGENRAVVEFEQRF